MIVVVKYEVILAVLCHGCMTDQKRSKHPVEGSNLWFLLSLKVK